MNIHILCAFYRKYMYKTLIHYYSQEGVIFHPICDEVDIEPFKDNKLEWVQPYICPPLRIPGDQVYKKFNDFMDNNVLIDDDYYTCIDDDSMYEHGLFDELKKRNADIVFISNYRGDRTPDDGSEPHPPYPLIMRRPEDVRVCNIGIGMFFVKGHILKNVRFGNTHMWDDGRFAENLLKQTPSIEFMTNWFVFGNYFQPGRHSDASKFLKPTWKLPEIIQTEFPHNWSMTYKR